MNEKYNTRFYANGEDTVLGCGFAILLLFIPFLFTALINKPEGVGWTFLVGALQFTAIIVFILIAQRASFDADDTQVTFSHLGRKTVIKFNDIKELKLERCNHEHNVKGGIDRFYVETLTITTAERTYSFSAQMDIDYDKVARNPASMTAQFENSEFSRLKRYIEEQKKLEDRLRRV